MDKNEPFGQAVIGTHVQAEKLLRRVVKFDERAQRLTEQAERYKAEAKNKIAENEVALRERYAAMAEARISQLEQSAEQTAQQSLPPESEHERARNSLKQRFDEGREQWLGDIVDRVLAREQG